MTYQQTTSLTEHYICHESHRVKTDAILPELLDDWETIILEPIEKTYR